MSKATISFDLSIQEDAYDYKCSMKGLEACLLLESIEHSLKQYQKHDLLPEIVLQDIISQMNKWETPK